MTGPTDDQPPPASNPPPEDSANEPEPQPHNESEADTEASGDDDTGESIPVGVGEEVGPSGILAIAAASRKPGVFIALTCGLAVMMCCACSTFGLGTWAALRMADLTEIRDDIGAPGGWEALDDAALPWAASASHAGPADAQTVSDWLADAGIDVDTGAVANCLTAKTPCERATEVDGYDVTITYGATTTDDTTEPATVIVTVR